MIVMPNTDPVIDEPSLVDFILRRAAATAKVRVLPMRRADPAGWRARP